MNPILLPTNDGGAKINLQQLTNNNLKYQTRAQYCPVSKTYLNP